MKKIIILLILSLLTVNSYGQIGMGISLARKLGKSHNPLKHLHSTIDTFHCEYGSVAYQRYPNKEIDALRGADPASYGGLVELEMLQDDLDKCQARIRNGQMEQVGVPDIAYIFANMGAPYIDRTHYSEECSFYKNCIQTYEARQKAISDSIYIAKIVEERKEIAAGRVKDSIQQHIDDSIGHIKYLRWEAERKKEERALLAQYTKKYGSWAAKKIMNGETWIGMTEGMCSDALGSPDETYVTETVNGKVNTWLYYGSNGEGGGLYMFEHGKMIYRGE